MIWLQMPDILVGTVFSMRKKHIKTLLKKIDWTKTELLLIKKKTFLAMTSFDQKNTKNFCVVIWVIISFTKTLLISEILIDKLLPQYILISLEIFFKMSKLFYKVR